MSVVAIDFTLSDGQQELQKNARAFAEGVLRPGAGRIDRAADGWEAFLAGREAYREMAHAGFTKSFIPAEYGGAGFSMLDLAIAAEELTRVDVNVPTTLLGSGLGLQPVIQYGTPEQKERFLRPFADDPEGDLLASYAFTDVAGGANFDSPDPAGGIQTIARRDGDEWVINGTKNWISNLGVADFYITFAVTDRDSRRLTAFVVEADRPGFSVGKLEHKLGIRASPTGQPIFEDVRVPQENVIGEVGRGLRVALGTLERTRLGAAAQAVGIAQGATDYAVAYARERVQFGQPIIELQAIQFKLADMETRTAAARELLYKACALADRGDPERGKYSSMAKVFCSDTAMAVTIEAVQVLGGYGYVKEYPVERMMRDAKITQIYEGTNEIQRLVIARTLK